MKKKISVLLMLVLITLLIPGVKAYSATESIPVNNPIDSIFETTGERATMHLPEESGSMKQDFSFKIAEKSFVRIAIGNDSYFTKSVNDGKVKWAISKSSEFKTTLFEGTFYGNDKFLDSECTILNKGTYYVRLKWIANGDRVTSHEDDLFVQVNAVPTTDGVLDIKLEPNPSNTYVKVEVGTGKLGDDDDELYSLQWRKGSVKFDSRNSSSYWETYGGNYELGTKRTVKKNLNVVEDSNSFKVTENGTYTVRVRTVKGLVWSQTFDIDTIDTEPPVVTGVEDYGVYETKVEITYEDAGSGIKSVTLNGKNKPKSGITVSKMNKYVLVVTDKAGNATTINFTIR